ncbi:MAG: hypothetical protein K2K93_05315 [Muribaculaceae bacterium]|nr:hypothetical protein [Muribaculaceae bacterium]
MKDKKNEKNRTVTDKEDAGTLLQYSNEDDRAYGLAGMAISLASLNAFDRVAEVSLDGCDTMVEFSNEYYFSGSPSISPKSTWDNLVQNFHITASMVISNVMSRSLVRMRRDVPVEVLGLLHDEIQREGKESCGLEDDEIDALFNRTLSYSRRIFANPRLHPAINEFARILSTRRTLSGNELRDELRLLQLI